MVVDLVRHHAGLPMNDVPVTTEHRLPLLDYCRFAAAASVLCFHYFWNGIANGKLSSLPHIDALTSWARYGYLGVNLFFIISGYVIFMSARRRDVAKFIVGRAVRLYPAYLFAMLTTAAFAFWIGGPLTHVSIKQVLANVLMYQPIHRHDFVDGVYWTLMIEIKFYAAVALLIWLGGQKHLETIAKLWPLGMAVLLLCGHGAWLDPARGEWGVFGGYFPFFAVGALFAVLRTSPAASTYAALALSVALALRFALAMCGHDATTEDLVVASAVVLGCTAVFFAVNASAGRITTLPMSTTLGALTYPLYLVHAHIGYMVLSRFGSPTHVALSYGLTIALVLVIAMAIHEAVEVRSMPFWRALFEGVMDIVQRAVARIRAEVFRVVTTGVKRFSD
jgi:peptidoglycan/LPS O-acetylase OafA/YrhL